MKKWLIAFLLLALPASAEPPPEPLAGEAFRVIAHQTMEREDGIYVEALITENTTKTKISAMTIQALPTCGAYSLTSFGGLALTLPTSGVGTGAGCNAVQVSNGTSTTPDR